MFSKSLKSLVKKNSLLWGEDVAEHYHGAAARDMQTHWSLYIEPALQRHPIDYTNTIDFACGYGRNTDFLLKFAEQVVMIDVNRHNVEYCQGKYARNPKINIKECNGYDLQNIPSASSTFFYTFDSMVHFPLKLVTSYMPEFFRVLVPGGYALIHHSNYSAAGPNVDFKQNPHWRNYMSAEIFAHIAKKAGFTIAEQTLHKWEFPDLDCISVLKKPG